MNKKEIRGSLFIAFIVSIYVLVLKPISERNLRNNFLLFNNSRIAGVVGRIVKGKISVEFNLKLVPLVTHTMYPINSGGTGSFKSTFSYLISVGDSVYKDRGSDTLYLYHKGEVHKFQFKKFL
jgi:hypothetical protein